MDAALGLGAARPAALAAGAGEGAGRAADRGVALVVKRVVGKLVLMHVAPDVLLGPVHEWVELPDSAPLVALHVLGVGPGGRLLAPDAGDPRLGSFKGPIETVHLGRAAAVLRAPGAGRVLHLHAQAVALLHLAPDVVGLREQH